MRHVTLGKTGITVAQNAFGALPIQRVPQEEAVRLLRKAYDGGMRFFDTARAYTDSEEKLGKAFGQGQVPRDRIYISTKTHASAAEGFWQDLHTSLDLLRTDYIDIYQLHLAPRCYGPGDESGLYECMVEAKKQGKIRHIGITAHRLSVAFDIVKSGLYETLQFPFSYLASDQEMQLVRDCEAAHIGFLCMKGLAGGLITRSDAAMAFMTQYPGALPLWGVQRERELDEWLAFMDKTPEMTTEIRAFIEAERRELASEFCRGCGYCMPCSADIEISLCNRMSLLLRRAPSETWLSEQWQNNMRRIEDCIDCRQCVEACPYELDVPNLLRKNYEDYKEVLAKKARGEEFV